MVFCDICVHQACYGIQNIPAGSWLCHPCRKGIKNCQCDLCLSLSGGAMKRIKYMNGKGWVHVSCALWIPEVGFGNIPKMEPVTRIKNIAMVEVYKGSGVFWYLGNRHSALNSTKTARELTAYLMDTFFTKETMAASNMNGGGKRGYQKLNPTIINAMQGFVLDDSHYGKQAGMNFNKTVQDKCCGARRGVSKGLTD